MDLSERELRRLHEIVQRHLAFAADDSMELDLAIYRRLEEAVEQLPRPADEPVAQELYPENFFLLHTRSDPESYT